MLTTDCNRPQTSAGGNNNGTFLQDDTKTDIGAAILITSNGDAVSGYKEASSESKSQRMGRREPDNVTNSYRNPITTEKLPTELDDYGGGGGLNNHQFLPNKHRPHSRSSNKKQPTALSGNHQQQH